MDSFLADMVNRLGALDVAVLMAAGILLIYFALSNRVLALMFMLVLSASLVATTVPIIGSIASLVRWLSLLLLLATGLQFGRLPISLALLLFWGYVFFGLVSMFRALSITWQLQRGLLLLLVALAIPFAYGNRSYQTHRATLECIAIVGALFAAVNAVALPGQLTDAARSIGNTKNAPALASVLGCLFPFLFWGTWNARSKALRILLGLGLLAGVATLLLSGQRTGTLAGIVSLIPLAFTMVKRKKDMLWSVMVVIGLALLGFIVVQHASEEKIAFLLSRYQLGSGLSGRGWIWEMAFSEIARSPLLGQGIGAAEWILSSSFHNAYLEIWFNTGFMGLALFVASQIYLLLRIRYLNRILHDSETKSILALALGYIMGFVVLCSFESVGAGASNLNLILYLYLGVLVSSQVLFETGVSRRSFGGVTPDLYGQSVIGSDHQVAMLS